MIVMNRRSKRNKLEFSKVVAVIGILMWMFVNLFGMAMMVVTYDLSPLAYVIGSVDAVVAVVLGFYFWKAKAENQIKLKKEFGGLYNATASEPVDDTLPVGYDTWGR